MKDERKKDVIYIELAQVLLAVYDESGERFSGLYRHSSEMDADTNQYGGRRILSQVSRGWMVLGGRQRPVNSPLRIIMKK